jgi:signal transduction histidine kinase
MFPDAGEKVRVKLAWIGGSVWLVAVAALHRDEDVLAHIQLARPLLTLLHNVALGATIKLAAAGPTPPGMVRVPIACDTDPPIALDVTTPDEARLALASVKQVLAPVMAVSGILLVVGIAIFLRRLLRPIQALIQAAGALGRGEFGLTVSGPASAEVAHLISAFNQMSLGLKRLRDLEREVAHREQLSAIGRVAARVAHDLNNPLTVIDSVARLVRKRTDIDDSLAADMAQILHHCERSITTIEALLSYGRPVVLRRKTVNLPELVADIGRGWQVRHRQIELDLPQAEPALTASVDPYRIEQVLDNLLDNAGSAGGRVGLSVGAEDGRCFIRVTDDGPGFSAEARAHLFEPFFTTKTGGTGLGLASSLAIIRAHGGDLVVSDTLPNTVTAWLPLTV